VIEGPPQVVLFAMYLLVRHPGEDFINVEGIAIASVAEIEAITAADDIERHGFQRRVTAGLNNYAPQGLWSGFNINAELAKHLVRYPVICGEKHAVQGIDPLSYLMATNGIFRNTVSLRDIGSNFCGRRRLVLRLIHNGVLFPLSRSLSDSSCMHRQLKTHFQELGLPICHDTKSYYMIFLLTKVGGACKKIGTLQAKLCLQSISMVFMRTP
jgi:hypothetical protein